MKKIFIITALIVTQFSVCQKTPNKLLKIEYNEFRIFTPSIINLDLGTLIVSNDYSFYSSKVIKKIKKEKIDDGESVGVNNIKEILSEIIIDRKKKILTEKLFDNIVLKKKYAVYEGLPKMKWKLLNEIKKIGNYECKKATTEFRGRKYEAWYTEKIPVSLGPWKLNGLPGVILMAEDKEGIYKWEAKLISYPYINSKYNINSKVKDDSKFEKISFEDFNKKRIEKIKEKIEIIKSRNSGRDFNVRFEYTTEQEKEPINEFRERKTFN
ncbi:GLPGLI family protein [Flavobacterium lacisediminis]|uniref:GLPGLI family protein n=1 Tax=Flavobacterium lacisediminis TaxID=2989705 RepID=A0ABT3EEN4_9FLAO|nr:GLPGLI family protein [Flavobacterium lacisediminis]MCW1147025.1 GLPGLI family protein [Flavobacterium lacisediminis]